MAETSSPAPPQSMEAILASIKRIIDEPAAPSAPAPPAGPIDAAVPVEPMSADEDVLELGAPPAPAPIETPPATIPAPLARPAAGREQDALPLVSAATHAASARAMAALASVAVDPNAPPHTLDALVRELLRPMLKDWLDANLPDLVERVVAREVARLGGR